MQRTRLSIVHRVCSVTPTGEEVRRTAPRHPRRNKRAPGVSPARLDWKQGQPLPFSPQVYVQLEKQATMETMKRFVRSAWIAFAIPDDLPIDTGSGPTPGVSLGIHIQLDVLVAFLLVIAIWGAVVYSAFLAATS